MAISLIKLTLNCGTPIFINVDHITAYWRHEGDNCTMIGVYGDPEPIRVKETIDEIIGKFVDIYVQGN